MIKFYSRRLLLQKNVRSVWSDSSELPARGNRTARHSGYVDSPIAAYSTGYSLPVHQVMAAQYIQESDCQNCCQPGPAGPSVS